MLWQWSEPADEPEYFQVLCIPVVIDLDADGSADIVLPSSAVFEEEFWDGITALTGTTSSISVPSSR